MVRWVDFAKNAIVTPNGAIVALYPAAFVGLISRRLIKFSVAKEKENISSQIEFLRPSPISPW